MQDEGSCAVYPYWKTCYRGEYSGSAPSDYTTTSDVHQTEYLLQLLVWAEKKVEKVSAEDRHSAVTS